MRVTLTAKLKNGVLWEAVEKVGGSQSELARRLGVSPQEVGGWLNFKLIPKDLTTPKMQQVEARLVALVGATLEDVFPIDLRESCDIRGKAKFRTTLTSTREVAVSQLLAAERAGLLSTGILDAVDDTEASERIHERIESVFESLSPSQRRIVTRRFGLDGEEEGTLAEVAEEMGLSRARVRQIECAAFKRLRRPTTVRRLKEYLPGGSLPSVRLVRPIPPLTWATARKNQPEDYVGIDVATIDSQRTQELLLEGYRPCAGWDCQRIRASGVFDNLPATGTIEK